jgi:hypothetical protein
VVDLILLDFRSSCKRQGFEPDRVCFASDFPEFPLVERITFTNRRKQSGELPLL